MKNFGPQKFWAGYAAERVYAIW